MEEICGDRLSELPDEVLVHILSFLPIVYAVRTVLLRRFGNLWAFVPKLHFDCLDFRKTFCDREYHKSEKTWAKCFRRFVRNVLLLYEAPHIESFVLRTDLRKKADEIKMWIRCALKRKPKVVKVSLDFYHWFHIPPCMFTSQSVSELYLYNCLLDLPIKAHMGSLRRLTLHSVRLDDTELHNVISGCPLLEELSIHYCAPMEDLSFSSKNIRELTISADIDEYYEVNCPNLNVLNVYGDVGLISLIDLSSVWHAKIFADSYIHMDHAPPFNKFMEALGGAEVLTTTDDSLTQLTCCPSDNLLFPRNRWKRVVLCTALYCPLLLLSICSLVRNAPCLEELIICPYPPDYDKDDADSYIKVDGVRISQGLCTPCVAPHLKIVKIYGNDDFTVLRQLVKFLLKSAVVLDKLVIVSGKEDKFFSRKGLKCARRLMSYPRASANASLLFE